MSTACTIFGEDRLRLGNANFERREVILKQAWITSLVQNLSLRSPCTIFVHCSEFYYINFIGI